MKKLMIFAVLFIAINSGYAQTENDKAYSETLNEMMEVAGSKETFNVAIKQMFAMFKQNYSEVDEKIWNDLESEMTKTSQNDIVDMLTPIYKKYLTIEDLRAMIAFYESPVGMKFTKNTPAIVQESMIVGQAWGEKIAEEFMKKMDEAKNKE